jgi:hypothetical protein
MADTALRPRTIIEILDGAFTLFRRDYLKFVSIMAVISLPYQAAMLWWNSTYFAEMMRSPSGGEDLGIAFGGMLLPFLGAILWNPIVEATIITAASDCYHGREVNIGATLVTFGRRVGTLLVAIFLRALVLLVGMILFVIPGIYFYLRFFNVPAAIMLEQASVSNSFSRSSVLTKGSKAKIAVTLIIVYLILGCLQFLSLFIVIFTSNVTVLSVIQALFNVLLYPLIPISMTLLYYDMRIRKEGYDIELMSKDLGEMAVVNPA